MKFRGPVLRHGGRPLHRADNRRQVLFVNDSGRLHRAREHRVDRVYGAEATFDVRLMGNLTSGQHHHPGPRVHRVRHECRIVGNELERQPNMLYNAGLYYDDGRSMLSLFTNYTGDNFRRLEQHDPARGLQHRQLRRGLHTSSGRQSARVGINVFNLFDYRRDHRRLAAPGHNQTTGGAYFVGRPVLPRRIHR